jgi:thiol-disulfide isomerase/thioredoxin
MADTATTFGIGDTVPSFTLTDTEGTTHEVPARQAPPATVLIQTCNHCPYVIAWNPRLRAVAEEYAPRGVRFLAINSNDPERYPADSPERMAPRPRLLDQVARVT